MQPDPKSPFSAGETALESHPPYSTVWWGKKASAFSSSSAEHSRRRLTSELANLGSSTLDTKSLAVCCRSSSGRYSSYLGEEERPSHPPHCPCSSQSQPTANRTLGGRTIILYYYHKELQAPRYDKEISQWKLGSLLPSPLPNTALQGGREQMLKATWCIKPLTKPYGTVRISTNR